MKKSILKEGRYLPDWSDPESVEVGLSAYFYVPPLILTV